MEQENLYLFDYEDFIEETLEDEKLNEGLLKYSEYYGNIQDIPLEETEFYKNYLSRFDTSGIKLRCPDDSENDFDYDLLTRLIVGSFSCDYELSLAEKWKASPEGDPLVELNIIVKVKSGSAQESLHELWTFQIIKMFGIYLREQIDVSNIIAEEVGDDVDEDDLDPMNEGRLVSLRKFELRKNQILEEAKAYQS